MRGDVLLKETPTYRMVVSHYKNIPITLRVWKGETGAEVFFDDNFARASGYVNKEHLLDKIGKESLISTFGCIPEWVKFERDGNFSFVLDRLNFN